MAGTINNPQILGTIADQTAAKIVTALDRNTAALLTVATVVADCSSNASSAMVSDWLKKRIREVHHSLM